MDARAMPHYPQSSLVRRRFGRARPDDPGARPWTGRVRRRAIADELVDQHPLFRFSPFRSSSSGYIVDTMRTVLHFYFETDGFEECLVVTVNEGGDADTTGALAGMLAGATYGYEALPQRWLATLDEAIVADIRRQSIDLSELWPDAPRQTPRIRRKPG